METVDRVEAPKQRPRWSKFWLGVAVVTVLGWCAAIAAFVHRQQVEQEVQVAIEDQRASLPDQLQSIRDAQADYVGKSRTMVAEAEKKLADLEAATEGQQSAFDERLEEARRLREGIRQSGYLHKELLEHREQLDAVYGRLKQEAELPYESLEEMWTEHGRLEEAVSENPPAAARQAAEAIP